MSRRVATRVQDLLRDGGHLQVRCRTCAHEAVFDLRDIRDNCHRLRLTDEWQALSRRFVCRECGRRTAQLIFALEPLPREHSFTPTRYIPQGVDPRRWLKATDSERKRMIRQARG